MEPYKVQTTRESKFDIVFEHKIACKQEAKISKILIQTTTLRMKNLSHVTSMPSLCVSDGSDTDSLTSSEQSSTQSDQNTLPLSKSSCLLNMTISNEAQHSETAVVPHTGYKKVLVTGGAGFIGSSVSQYLLARGDDVVIIDEMNDYYDVSIKEDNLKMLKEEYPEEGRVAIYRGDICDKDLLSQIF